MIFEKIFYMIHAADPEIGFRAKSISKSDGCATAMPTAWELIFSEWEILVESPT